MKSRAERTDITADRVLGELAKIGFADIRKAVKWQSAMITEEDNPDGGDIAVIKTVVTNTVQMVASDELDDGRPPPSPRSARTRPAASRSSCTTSGRRWSISAGIRHVQGQG